MGWSGGRSEDRNGEVQGGAGRGRRRGWWPWGGPELNVAYHRTLSAGHASSGAQKPAWYVE